MRFDGRRLMAAMVPLLVVATAPPARAVISQVGQGWINSFYNSRCAGGPGAPVTSCTGFPLTKPQKPAQLLPFDPDGPEWPDHPTQGGWAMAPNPPMTAITGQVLPFGPYQYHYIDIHDIQTVGARSHFRFAMRGGRNFFNLPALEIRALNLFQEGSVPPFPAAGKAIMQHNFSLDYPLTATGNPPFILRTRFFPSIVLRGATSFARFSFQLRFYRVENPNVGPDEYLLGVNIDETYTAPPFVHTTPILRDFPIGSIATGNVNTTLRMTGHVRLEGDPAEVFISDRSDPLGPRDVQCYDMKPASSLRANVSLADAFAAADVRLTGPDLMCAPANVNEGDPDAASRPEHLTGYRSKFRFSRLRGVPVSNLLGGAIVDIIRPDRLLVPTAKSLAPPPPAPLPQPSSLGSYQCYRVRITPGTPVGPFNPVEVEDQFGTVTVTPRRPFRLCMPVNVNNEDPAAVAQPPILCYRTLRTPFERQTVWLTDRFRSAESRLKRRKQLCVESAIAGP